jgi:filamentous hemagglutinin
MGAEAGAKYVANYLYPGVKPSDLTAEQKATVSSIMSLAGLGVGATTGDVGSAVSAGEAAKTAVEDNLLSPADQKKLLELYSKAEKEEGFLGIGKYKLSLDDSINLTNLAILDQVGNGLISKYKANPKSLTADELTVLNKILNYYYSNGGKLEDIANLFKPGSSMSNDYLLRKGINGTQEEIFIQAANTRRIQSAVEENARMGGDAVWAAPGGFMNIVRGVVGSATVASGIKDVQNGKKGEGAFKIVGGSLMFVPINGKSGFAVNSPSFATLINNSGREINLVVKNRGSIPSNIETQSLIAEHSKQNVAPLTQAGVNTIYDNVIPNGTYAKVAGDNVAGPDVFVYSQHAGVVVDTIQFKAASGLRSVENNIKDDLKKPLSYTQGSNIIAVQVPAGGEASNALRLQNKLGNISRSSAGNRQIIIVDSNGKLLIPLQPLRNFSKK